MKGNRFYLHVGYGKTATTLLQEEIFPNIAGVNYIGKRQHDYPDWMIKWVYLDDILFFNGEHDVAERLDERLSDDMPNLMSSEAFMNTGGVHYSIIQRIKAIRPDAGIIITLRDPIDKILSFYKYTVQVGHFYKTLRESIDMTETPMVLYKRRPIYLPDFYYSDIIREYQKAFGSENVLVLKYEEIKQETDKFFGKLGDFINVDIDMDMVRSAMEKKVNITKPESVAKARGENMHKLIKENFPDAACQCSAGDFVSEGADVLDEDLKEEIISRLKGRCWGYY
jgi:hypothetical protein